MRSLSDLCGEWHGQPRDAAALPTRLTPQHCNQSHLVTVLGALWLNEAVHRLVAKSDDHESQTQYVECFHSDPIIATAACEALLSANPCMSIYLQLNSFKVDETLEVGGQFVSAHCKCAHKLQRWRRVIFSFAPNSCFEECHGSGSAAEVIEHVAAVVAVMERNGWPAPIVAVNGSTVTAFFESDCVVADHVSDLISDALLAMSRRFDTEAVVIDRETSEAEMKFCIHRTVENATWDGLGQTPNAIKILKVPVQPPLIEVEHLYVLAADQLERQNRNTVDFLVDAHVDARRLTFVEFLRRLRGVRRSSDGSAVAVCPAHCDRNPSLSVREGDDGRVLLYCHAGCSFDEICKCLGISPWQLFPPRASCQSSSSSPTPLVVEANLELHGFSEQCASSTTDAELEVLATQLGVTIASLRWLQVGWSPRDGAWTVPERRPDGWVVGIQLRAPDGSKRMITGSHRGLILPWEWWQYSGRVYLPEGASDVAALLTHGLPAIGRSSANGSITLLAELLRPTTLTPVVLGENDAKPDGRWPGRDGAERCAHELAAALQRPVEIAFPPPAFKDVREFTQSIRTGAL